MTHLTLLVLPLAAAVTAPPRADEVAIRLYCDQGPLVEGESARVLVEVENLTWHEVTLPHVTNWSNRATVIRIRRGARDWEEHRFGSYCGSWPGTMSIQPGGLVHGALSIGPNLLGTGEVTIEVVLESEPRVFEPCPDAVPAGGVTWKDWVRPKAVRVTIDKTFTSDRLVLRVVPPAFAGEAASREETRQRMLRFAPLTLPSQALTLPGTPPRPPPTVDFEDLWSFVDEAGWNPWIDDTCLAFHLGARGRGLISQDELTTQLVRTRERFPDSTAERRIEGYLRSVGIR